MTLICQEQRLTQSFTDGLSHSLPVLLHLPDAPRVRLSRKRHDNPIRQREGDDIYFKCSIIVQANHLSSYRKFTRRIIHHYTRMINSSHIYFSVAWFCYLVSFHFVSFSFYVSITYAFSLESTCLILLRSFFYLSSSCLLIAPLIIPSAFVSYEVFRFIFSFPFTVFCYSSPHLVLIQSFEAFTIFPLSLRRFLIACSSLPVPSFSTSKACILFVHAIMLHFSAIQQLLCIFPAVCRHFLFVWLSSVHFVHSFFDTLSCSFTFL